MFDEEQNIFSSNEFSLERSIFVFGEFVDDKNGIFRLICSRNIRVTAVHFHWNWESRKYVSSHGVFVIKNTIPDWYLLSEDGYFLAVFAVFIVFLHSNAISSITISNSCSSLLWSLVIGQIPAIYHSSIWTAA